MLSMCCSLIVVKSFLHFSQFFDYLKSILEDRIKLVFKRTRNNTWTTFDLVRKLYWLFTVFLLVC